jgi:DNA-directed RNA polymerase subunit RPC12/RpoP
MEISHSKTKSCPRCGSRRFTRSHRRGIAERFVLRALQIRPYRCAACDGRFYSREMPRQEVASRTV